jgi:hypothetical protein
MFVNLHRRRPIASAILEVALELRTQYASTGTLVGKWFHTISAEGDLRYCRDGEGLTMG